MFGFLNKKETCIKDEVKKVDNNKMKDRFQRYIDLVDEQAQYAKILIGIIVEHLNYEKALQAIETEHNAQKNSLIEEIYSKIENIFCLTKNITHIEKVHKDDENSYKGINLVQKDPLEVDINKLPILLNPWNSKRIINNFMVISNNNVFDGTNNRHKYNIQNHYLYPMNIVVCNGANHSQLSARYQNKGKTVIKEIKDFRLLYDKIKFDGDHYIKVDDNTVIELKYDENILFYSGVIFELGRYLLGKNHSNSSTIGSYLNLQE